MFAGREATWLIEDPKPDKSWMNTGEIRLLFSEKKNKTQKLYSDLLKV